MKKFEIWQESPKCDAEKQREQMLLIKWQSIDLLNAALT